MEKHIALSDMTEMSPIAFQQWLIFWEKTIDEHFYGSKAEEAKIRARNIASLMQFKIQQHQGRLDIINQNYTNLCNSNIITCPACKVPLNQ